jgi:type IV pilus assembly protein PilM
MSWTDAIKRLFTEPPPEYVFEISESGIAWAKGQRPAIGFAPLENGVLSISPLSDNLVRPDVFQAEVFKLATNGSGKAKSKNRGAVLVLPDYCARIAVLDFDTFPAKAEEQVSLIRFRMKKSVPFDVDSAAISYYAQPHASGEKKLDVVVSLVALETLARYEAPFRATGLQPGLVTTSTLAAMDLAPASIGEEFSRGGSVVVKLAGKVLTVSVLVRGTLKLVRCLELEEMTADAVANVLLPTLVYMEDELKVKAGAVAGCGLGAMEEPVEQMCMQELGLAPAPLRSRLGEVTGVNAGLLGYLESRGRA